MLSKTTAPTIMRSIRGASILDRILTKKFRDPPEEEYDFLTFTLSPKMYRFPAKVQYHRTCDVLKSVLNYFTKDYSCVTEITKDGNVHYHGWVIYNVVGSRAAIIDALKANYKFGFVKCEVLKNVMDASFEIKKQYLRKYLTKEFIKTYSFIRDKDIVFNKQMYEPFVNGPNNTSFDMAYIDAINSDLE